MTKLELHETHWWDSGVDEFGPPATAMVEFTMPQTLPETVLCDALLYRWVDSEVGEDLELYVNAETLVKNGVLTPYDGMAWNVPMKKFVFVTGIGTSLPVVKLEGQELQLNTEGMPAKTCSVETKLPLKKLEIPKPEGPTIGDVAKLQMAIDAQDLMGALAIWQQWPIDVWEKAGIVAEVKGKQVTIDLIDPKTSYAIEHMKATKPTVGDVLALKTAVDAEDVEKIEELLDEFNDTQWAMVGVKLPELQGLMKGMTPKPHVTPPVTYEMLDDADGTEGAALEAGLDPLWLQDAKLEECGACKTKPGMPFLCDACLKNRATISALQAALCVKYDDAPHVMHEAAVKNRKAMVLMHDVGKRYREAELRFNAYAPLGPGDGLYDAAVADLLQMRELFEKTFGVKHD